MSRHTIAYEGALTEARMVLGYSTTAQANSDIIAVANQLYLAQCIEGAISEAVNDMRAARGFSAR